jgi:WD40 repeat protein
VGHQSRITALAYSPSGAYLAAADYEQCSRVTIWSVEKSEVVVKLFGMRGKKAEITSLVFSPDGKTIAACSYDFVGVWETTTGKKLREYAPAKGSIYSVCISADANWLLIGIEGDVLELRIEDGKLRKVASVQGNPEDLVVGTFSLSSDSKDLFFWRGERDHSGRIVRVGTGETKSEFKKGHELPPLCSCFASGGDHVATAGRDGRLVLWDAKSGMPLKTYTIDKSPVEAIDYCKGTSELFAGTKRGTLLSVDVKSKKAHRITCGDPISCLAISPSGTILAVAYGDGNQSAHAKVNSGLLKLLYMGAVPRDPQTKR